MRCVRSPKSQQVAGFQNLKRRRKTTIQAFWSRFCFELQTSICQVAIGITRTTYKSKLEPYFLLTECSLFPPHREISIFSRRGTFSLGRNRDIATEDSFTNRLVFSFVSEGTSVNPGGPSHPNVTAP